MSWRSTPSLRRMQALGATTLPLASPDSDSTRPRWLARPRPPPSSASAWNFTDPANPCGCRNSPDARLQAFVLRLTVVFNCNFLWILVSGSSSLHARIGVGARTTEEEARMARRIRPSILAASIWIIVLVPANALAQSAIAGVVKDPSGAVLPGVTVEASSDVLIEKTRTVVTNGQGQYLIVDLRPGIYSLSFTLTGFSSLKRDGVNLPSSFVATINFELKVATTT